MLEAAAIVYWHVMTTKSSVLISHADEWRRHVNAAAKLPFRF